MVLLLFRTDDLPPPLGTGGPVNVVVVPERELFGGVSQGAVGPSVAPFTIPAVPAGDYQIRAFLDVDGDFHPNVSLLSQPTAGDVSGGYVDSSGQFVRVRVENDVVSAQLSVRLGVPVPKERPAFAMTSTTTFDLPLRATDRLLLESHVIQGNHVRFDPACTFFLVRFVDENNDGTPDDQDRDGLPDIYPRVLLRRLADDDDKRNIVVPARVDPAPFLDALSQRPTGVPAARVELVISSGAQQVTEDGPRPLSSIPPGRYETLVVSATGQTWQVPNNLNQVESASPADRSQSATVVFRDE